MKVSITPAPVREQARQNIKKAIIEGYFKPGQRLVEKELCDLVGVSRSPIREALRQLESEGLIKMMPNKGPVVASFSIRETKDIYEVRKILEAQACKVFAERADQKDVDDLKKTFKALEWEINAGKSDNLIDFKEDFYQILLEGSKNKLLSSMHSSLRARITFLRKTSLTSPGRARKSLEEIRKIVSAIERRDATAAWEYSIVHVENARDILIDILQRTEAKNVQPGGPSNTSR